MTTNDQMMTQRKHQRVSPEVRWEDETTHCDAGSSDRLDRWCHGNVCLCWWLTAGTIWRLTHSERQAHLIQENNTWQIAIRMSRFIIKRNLHLSANGKGRFKTSSLGQSWGGAIFFSFCSHYQPGINGSLNPENHMWTATKTAQACRDVFLEMYKQ